MPTKNTENHPELAPYYRDMEQQLSAAERAILHALHSTPRQQLHRLGRELGLKATELRADLHRLTEKKLICTTGDHEPAYKLTPHGERLVNVRY